MHLIAYYFSNLYMQLLPFFRRIFGTHADALVLTACVTLWCSAKEFTNFLSICHMYNKASCNKISTIELKESAVQIESLRDGTSWKTIQQKYESLKILTDLINSVHGLSITCFLVVSVLEYAIGLDEVFVEGTKTICGKVISVFYFVQKCVILVIAADIGRLVN